MALISRRQLLSHGAVAALAVAFDPSTRRWLRAGEAAPAASRDAPVPPLDGELVTEADTRQADSTDAGYIIVRQPWAILRPGSVDDIATMIRYCGRHRIPVAARGQGHSVFGQPLVEGGLVIETVTLATIHTITPGWADVDSGVTWRELVRRTVATGRTPPVLTGFLGLSVGGTLSVGGVSSRNDLGFQVDRVRRLQVVTGEGRVVWCSASEEPELFLAVLGGLGQFGIITRAVLDLVPAPRRVRYWVLQYPKPDAFFTDLWSLLRRGEFDHIYGQVGWALNAVASDAPPEVPLASVDALRQAEPLLSPALRAALSPGGSLLSTGARPVPTNLVYQLHLAKHYRPGPSPDDLHLLRDLHDVLPLRQRFDSSYHDFVLRVDGLVEVLKAAGLWNGVPHPWVDNFLPGHVGERFVTETVSRLRFDDLGAAGLIFLFPHRRAALTRPSVMVPNSDPDWVLLFSILTSAMGPEPGEQFIREKLLRNRGIFEEARMVGGKLYPISAVPMERSDWAAHYGSRYEELVALKAHNDPDGIMTPGPGVF